MLEANQELVDQFELDLRSHATAISLDVLCRTDGTFELTRFIYKWSLSHGFHCEREVYLGSDRISRKTGRAYRGFLDFVIGHWLAVEIDSSNKRWSLAKLEDAAQRGYVPVWIRWSTPQKLHVPSYIHLILLPSRTRLKTKTREQIE